MVSLDGVAPNRMVCVSASVNLSLHHKVQKFSGAGSPGWSQKKGRTMVVIIIITRNRKHRRAAAKPAACAPNAVNTREQGKEGGRVR